jgi:hypothetical protein
MFLNPSFDDGKAGKRCASKRRGQDGVIGQEITQEHLSRWAKRPDF